MYLNNIHTPYQAVIFDFDYTLADSSCGVVECVSFALNRLGLPPASREAICQTIGLSLSDAFLRLAGPGESGRCHEFIRLFTRRAGEVMALSTLLYATVPPAIKQLTQHDLKLGILSNKLRSVIETVLEREGLREPFNVIIGREDLACHKPDPAGLLAAQARLGSAPAETLYVGDSLVDAETARRGGLPFLAVLSGLTPRQDFAAYPAATLVDDLSQAADWILKEPRHGPPPALSNLSKP